MSRQLLLLLAALAVGTTLALLVGAKNLGTAIAIAQLCVAAMLVYVLMRD
jgi:hypothetical protein